MASGLLASFFFLVSSLDYLQLLSSSSLLFIVLWRFFISSLCVFSGAEKNTAGGYNNFSQY